MRVKAHSLAESNKSFCSLASGPRKRTSRGSTSSLSQSFYSFRFSLSPPSPPCSLPPPFFFFSRRDILTVWQPTRDRKCRSGGRNRLYAYKKIREMSKSAYMRVGQDRVPLGLSFFFFYWVFYELEIRKSIRLFS